MVAIVFVPLIGFRPGGTRTLRERIETTDDATQLIVHRVAAAPDRTDIVVEWRRTGDPVTCPPDSKLLVHSNRAPLQNGLIAQIVTGGNSLDALAVRRRGYHMSLGAIGAVDELTFPSLPADVDEAELRLSEGASIWRVPVALADGGIAATPLNAAASRQGIVVRATALVRYDDELIVALEVEAPHQIRQVGAPVPSPEALFTDSKEDRRARKAEMHRHFGARARPIALEDDGRSRDEVRRLFSQEPQQAGTGPPFVSRFVVMFEAPAAEATRATLVIPFVELNDLGPSATADLSALPLDVEFDQHRFRVVAMEPEGADRHRVVLEMPQSASGPRFVQPARLRGADPAFAWERAVAADPPRDDLIWMATKVGDPPIVTFTGVVLRVDGPLRLDLALDGS